MGGSKVKPYYNLEVDIAKLRTMFAGVLEIKRADFRVDRYPFRAPVYSVQVSWDRVEALIGEILPAGAKYSLTRHEGVYRICFDYIFNIYTYNSTALSYDFLLDTWNIEEEPAFLGEIIYKIVSYIFTKFYSVSDYYGSKASLFFRGDIVSCIDLKFDTAGEKPRYEVIKMKLLDKDRTEVKLVELDEDKLGRLAYEIYKASIFTIDIPVAYSLVWFWASIIDKVFSKFLTAVVRDIEFLGID